MSGSLLAPVLPRVNTPRRLVAFTIAIVVIAALAAAASLWAATSVIDAARTIGRDAEPSVALALRIKATLGDLDAASFSDSLTDGGATIGTSRRFRDGMDRLGAAVVAAAGNVTYGDAETVPIGQLQQTIAQYAEAIVEARTLAPGNLWLTSKRIQWASRVNRDFAVPAADALAGANAEQLEQRYVAYRASSLLLGGLALLLFAILALAMLGVQAWLVGRVRRLVNPLLALATVVAGGAGLWFGVAVLTEREDLRIAKADAYDSLHVLFEAKAAANAVRADMSFWLLDPTARADAQGGIDASLRALLNTDLTRPDQTRPLLDGLGRALTLERQNAPSRAIAEAPRPGGLLGAELGNITFGEAEREAASQSIADLAYADEVLRAVQAQEQRRDHTFAVVRWLDETARGGTGAFLDLQAALDRTIAVNQAAFDERVGRALRRAEIMPFVTTGALIAAALLAVGGLWLRLREYR